MKTSTAKGRYRIIHLATPAAANQMDVEEYNALTAVQHGHAANADGREGGNP